MKWPRRLVVIGASAFGPPLVCKLLQSLADTRNTAFFLIQHAFSAEEMRKTYEKTQPFPFRMPDEREAVSTGTLYAADRGRHMIIEPGEETFHVRHTDLAELFPFCPAIDVTMATAAHAAKAAAIGVLVSGFSFGRDGSLGGIAIREKGGRVYGVEEGAKKEGLVKEAMNSGSINELLPLAEVAVKLRQLDALHPRFDFRPLTDDAAAAQRRHFRLKLPFIVTIDGLTESTFRDRGKVIDISSGGLRYAQAAKAPSLAVGERIMVALHPPEGDKSKPWLKEMGKIVRVDTTGGLSSEIAIAFDSEISFGNLIRP